MVWRAATARDATPSPHGLSRGTNILSRSRTSLPASAAAVAAAQPAGPAPTTTTSTLQDLIFPTRGGAYPAADGPAVVLSCSRVTFLLQSCLLYTSDAADDLTRVDLGGRRIIKKKKNKLLHKAY